jgi:hypothetical protein
MKLHSLLGALLLLITILAIMPKAIDYINTAAFMDKSSASNCPTGFCG